MKRTINTGLIKEKIAGLIYEASFILPAYVEDKLRQMHQGENAGMAKDTLGILLENAEIAKKEELPLCQDCGIAIIFLEIGQDVDLEGSYINDAVNEGVEEAYSKYYLRKSVAADPLQRTGQAAGGPAVIHTEIVPGDRVKLTVYLKGGGSENMSAVRMFNPTDSVEMIIRFIEETVLKAGPNPCPPLFLGIGIGGTADTAVLNAKKALFRGTEPHPVKFYRELEKTIEERVNRLSVGPLGFGGRYTTAGVYIKEAPAHIATLPVALNLGCHSMRYRTAVL